MSAKPLPGLAQVSFWQTVGLPERVVSALYSENAESDVVRAVAQWRLDGPLPRGELPGDRTLTSVSVAEAILARGSTPFTFPKIDSALDDLFGVGRAEAAQLVSAVRTVALRPTSPPRSGVFDSDEEKSLHEAVTDWIQRFSLAWVVTSQIELAGLAPSLDVESGLRGDMLLAHPTAPPVVVEVDGFGHDSHAGRDAGRDEALQKVGLSVVRVSAAEARAGSGDTLERLLEHLRNSDAAGIADDATALAIRWSRALHQLQITLLQALKSGFIQLERQWKIAVELPAVLGSSNAARAGLVELAVAELRGLLTRLHELYGREINPDPDVVCTDPHRTIATTDVLLRWGDPPRSAESCPAEVVFQMSDVYVPAHVRSPSTPAETRVVRAPSRSVARWFLQYIFRKDDFLEGQWETIERTLEGKDSILLLPTGGGKTIAFQLASLMLPGRCIVVDPIIALINDQLDNLTRVGIDRAVGITGGLKSSERAEALAAFAAGHYLFTYVAPERFQKKEFRARLRALTAQTPVSAIVIDEAHCVSEWGHDFRTAYLNLGRVTRECCAYNEIVPPVLALTGTASKAVLRDVQRALEIRDFDALISPKTFDRPELRFRVVGCKNQEKAGRLEGQLHRLPGTFGRTSQGFYKVSGADACAGLVFCPHVNGEHGIVERAKDVSNALQIRVGTYSGTAPRGRGEQDWEFEKRRNAGLFKRDRLNLLVCTKAFGMGIDKPNIRYTIHMGLPGSIEAFYQEAGRAGRDRGTAECTIILSNDDRRRTQLLLNPDTPLEEVARIVEAVSWDDADDVTRALWFHVRAFRGVESEVKDVKHLLGMLGNIASRRQVNVAAATATWSRSEAGVKPRERIEKALHRLVEIGVVEDYTVDFANREFAVVVAGAERADIATATADYVRAYQSRLGDQMESRILAMESGSHLDFVLDVTRSLIQFIYRQIELSRRRSLLEMLEAATVSVEDGDKLRGRILTYLQRTEWDARLDEIVESEDGGLPLVGEVLEEVVTPTDAAALRGAVGRTLGSYPDVPGLLLLRAAAELLALDGTESVAGDNVAAAIRFSAEKFSLNATQLGKALGRVVRHVSKKGPAADAVLAMVLTSPHTNRELVRALLSTTPIERALPPAQWLAARVAARCRSVMT